jgi:hypothetical protein
MNSEKMKQAMREFYQARKLEGMNTGDIIEELCDMAEGTSYEFME